jgi:hypothetical protein
MAWTRHAALMLAIRNKFRSLVRRHEGKRSFQRLEDDITM